MGGRGARYVCTYAAGDILCRRRVNYSSDSETRGRTKCVLMRARPRTRCSALERLWRTDTFPKEFPLEKYLNETPLSLHSEPFPIKEYPSSTLVNFEPDLKSVFVV
ncbi:hypothetical protein EVAR_56719_1 [Eumeta japonica]|uniref:Uncharacterized protein n=1 Tax=Eumeta variegata TaxID=151549 RepID=A0A4C1XXY1_EUMVA|nr:hypothetical protein EVAR_56719_1 [Eumeta japonica]